MGVKSCCMYSYNPFAESRVQTLSSTPRLSTSTARPPLFRSVIAPKGQQTQKVKVKHYALHASGGLYTVEHTPP